MPAYSSTGVSDLTKLVRYVRSVTLSETSGAAVTRWQLRNGSDTTNDLVLIPMAAVAGGAASFTPAKPVYFPKGVRVELVSGAGRITVDGY